MLLARPVQIVSLLGASVAVPYAVTNSDSLVGYIQFSNSPSVSSPSILETTFEEDNEHYQRMIDQVAKGPGSELLPAGMPLEGLPVMQFGEVFRFDIRQDWVYGRWPRKSTAVLDWDLHGVRVPLVTGTAFNDLAGSMTYYFDGHGVLQQIRFRGKTGDPNRVIAFATSQFAMMRVLSNQPGEQVFQAGINGAPHSQLRISPAATLWSTSPHNSFEVDMTLNRPGNGRVISVPGAPAPPTGPKPF